MTSSTFDTGQAAARLVGTLVSWRVIDGRLCRTYRTRGWKSSLMIANAIGHLAETAWHHPDLLVAYGRVEVRLVDHDAGGISARDFALAEKIEELVAWRPADPLKVAPERFTLLEPDDSAS
ncbi:MAG: 4a-hydroxytetrahydrobiopterin dehydratase [Geminicoccaceae bacterium]|nr:4a-hydroxytetrahydrobiopterin dehydratase [Geminicoccaceae bacterium]